MPSGMCSEDATTSSCLAIVAAADCDMRGSGSRKPWRRGYLRPANEQRHCVAPSDNRTRGPSTRERDPRQSEDRPRVLKGVKYSIDYYQREYKWRDKQIRELVDDLVGKFLEEYEHGHSRTQGRGLPPLLPRLDHRQQEGGASYIVDGQQRLTSLTLLLIHLRNLQAGRDRPGQRRRAHLL